MPENLTDLLARAEQAFEQGDQRGAGILANRILKQDFTHQGAWELLYAMLGNQQTFDAFQHEFANKHFPDKAALLPAKSTVKVAPRSMTAPSILKQAVAVNQPAPVLQTASRMPVSVGMNVCPRCGQTWQGVRKFCPYCGVKLLQIEPVVLTASTMKTAAANYSGGSQPGAAVGGAPSQAAPRKRRSVIGCLAWLIVIGLLSFIAVVVAWPYLKGEPLPPILPTSLPREALTAIDDYLSKKQLNPLYTVMNSQRATRLSPNEDEAWCIIIDSPNTHEILNVIAIRQGLHWSLQERAGAYFYPALSIKKEDFEIRGCSIS